MTTKDADLMNALPTSGTSPLEKAIDLGAIQFTMELHPDSDKIMNPVLLRDGIWEPTETSIFSAFLGTSKLVFDIGANIGWYSLVAGRTLQDTGRVVAFEPEPGVGAILDRNIARNGMTNVEVVHAAVADRETQAAFATIANHVGDHHPVQGAQQENVTLVPVTTVDIQQKRCGEPVDLIKIDTQGAELSIFRGMTSLLATQTRKPIIISEFWPHGLRRLGSDGANYASLIESLGYEAFVIDDASKSVRPISFSALQHRIRTDLDPRDLAFIDLVLVPKGDPRRALLEPFLKPYGLAERLWRYRLRPVMSWSRRRMRSARKSAQPI